jgi:hypothetical protein
MTPDSDSDEWIEDALNEDRRPLPSWFDDSELELRGFVRWEQDDKQVGFHPGQNDTPDKFTPALTKEGYDFILKMTDRGQFDVHYEVWTRKEAPRVMLIDGANGINVPLRFAQNVDRERVKGVSASDWDTLDAGPDHPDYWEVWDDVLRLASMTMDDGTVVEFEQDDDLFYRDSNAEFCEYMDAHYVHKQGAP